MNLLEFIESNEGRRATPYLCPAGYKTIGVGWNIDSNPLPPDIAEYLAKNGSITEEMIDRLLLISVRHAVADARVLFPKLDSFSGRRRIALIDFVFQLGFHRARTFRKSIKLINEERFGEAEFEMLNSEWAKQTPVRAKRVASMVGDNDADQIS